MKALQREAWRITSRGEWLDWRENDITASPIGALWGVHPYVTPEQFAAQKRGERITLTTSSLRAGTILEPAVAEAMRLEHPDWTITKATEYCRLPDCRLGCTPDYFFANATVRRGILQCKTVSPQQWDNWRGTVPLAYTLQTLTEMLVTDADAGVLAVLIRSPSYPLYEFEVSRHKEAETRILDAVAAWWKAWDRGEIAAPQSVEELETLLDNGEHLDWSGNDEMRLLLEQRRALKAEVSARTQQLGEIDYTIKNHIGPASSAWLPGWQIEFRRRQRKEYTVAAAEIRTLRIKETSVE